MLLLTLIIIHQVSSGVLLTEIARQLGGFVNLIKLTLRLMVEMGMDKMFTSGRLVVTKINNGSLTNKQNIHMKKYLNRPSFIKKVIPATISLFLGTLSVSAQLPNSGDSFLNVPYKTVSGQTLRLDIYTPNSSGPTPVVVYTHGGGWSSGNKNHIEIGRQRSVALELLEAGIAVVTVQYRLATTASGSTCLLYTSPSPRDQRGSRMPSSA